MCLTHPGLVEDTPDAAPTSARRPPLLLGTRAGRCRSKVVRDAIGMSTLVAASTARPRSPRWRCSVTVAASIRRPTCSAPCDLGWLRKVPGRRPRTRHRPSQATSERSSAQTGCRRPPAPPEGDGSAASSSSDSNAAAVAGRQGPRDRAGPDPHKLPERPAAADHRTAERGETIADPRRRRDGVRTIRRLHRDWR